MFTQTPTAARRGAGECLMPEREPRLPDIFYTAIEQEIDQHPTGITEYDLIRALRARGFFTFLSPPPAPPHQLFRTHFLLFHALYVLRGRLHSSRQGDLEITALCIRRLPSQPGDTTPAPCNPLASYYLDWANLDGTTEKDVSDLIDSFWRRLGSMDTRAAALSELGLEDPVSDATIKLTWRRLAMEHHPDRGGDNERLQAINAAVDHLLTCR